MSGVVQVWGACLECTRPWIQPSALPKGDRKKKSLLVEDVETVLWEKKKTSKSFFLTSLVKDNKRSRKHILVIAVLMLIRQ